VGNKLKNKNRPNKNKNTTQTQRKPIAPSQITSKITCILTYCQKQIFSISLAMKNYLIFISSKISKFFGILAFHSGTLVAIATFLLAVSTYDMVKETKKLADLSMEQFKIKSYPVLVIANENISIYSERPSEELIIKNEGELAAFNFTLLYVHVYDKNNGNYFIEQPLTYFEGDKENLSMDMQIKIPSRIGKKITNSFSTDKEVEIKQLKHRIIFLKFKVPYDDVYRYEIYGYRLIQTPGKEDNQVMWQEVNSTYRDKLLALYFKVREFKTRIPKMKSNPSADLYDIERRLYQFFGDYVFD
jgi:hypothetical protein